MIQILFRWAKRLAVFLPGAGIAYLSLRYTFPFFDKRLPDSLAIIVTYVLAAYVLIPAIIRLWRQLWPPDHVPLYCITPDGFASDPINIAFMCTRRELISAMTKAGWHLCDRERPDTMLRHVLSVLFNWSYLSAPVSKLYLFGRRQDLAFAQPIGPSPINRHHVRFWATTYQDGKSLKATSIHWHNRKAHVQGDKLLWVGAASLDSGLMPIRHNFQLTHKVDPDTNSERELIVSQLKSQKLIKSVKRIKLGDPYTLVNRTWRGELRTDGIMAVVSLKPIRPKLSNTND